MMNGISSSDILTKGVSSEDESKPFAAKSDKKSISLRNSAYWFRRISAQRRVVDRGPRDEEKIEVDIVYEHQRYNFLLGWGSKGHLLPMDPKKYTDSLNKRAFQMFPTVRLPMHNAATDGSWEWISSWKIDNEHDPCDEDGWTYGKSFSAIRSHNGHNVWKTSKALLVRRRRWVRLRRYSAGGIKQSIAIDESHLDCVRGFLNKLGHRRKSWKKRYFQLQASRLLYYKDESRSKLKGEVLLYHQSIKVQYVDIRVSGRENTFSIDVGGYNLLLQANTPQDREDWIYAIEDAILCRDSYSDDKGTKQRRDEVLRRRSISADLLKIQTMSAMLVPGLESQDLIEHNVDRNRISRFVRKFQTHYYSAGLFSSHSVEQRGKEFFKLYRNFIEMTINKLLDQQSAPRDKNIDLAENALMRLRDTLLRELERITFIPLQEIMYQLLDDVTDDMLIKEFERKKNWLSQKPQEFFEIDANHISPTYWEAPIALLNSLDSYSLPCEKASILVHVAHSIALTYEEEHGNKNTDLAADDFLPIFVYVLSNCSLKNTVTTRGLVTETMIHSIGVGEKGYYITMLEAAVEYIASFTHPMLPDDILSNSPSIGPDKS